MKRWATADWHLGETRFAIMGRPFIDQQQMIDELVKNHNNIVSCEDDVYVLGDVCYKEHPQFLEQVNRFNGRKILIRGNHDRVFNDEQLNVYFDQIIPDGKGIDIEIGEISCYMTHYPSTGVEDKFNIVGHIHSAWRFQLNMFNVGDDANNYRPVDLDNTFPAIYNFICNASDQDVFSAYNQINTKYIEKRGRKNSYFDSKKN